MRLRQKTNNIAPTLSKRQRRMGRVAPKAHDYFKKITPIDSGNAKRRTRLQGETIKADYPYATRLDNGYSKQAPQGMSEPTIDYIQDLVRDIILGR